MCGSIDVVVNSAMWSVEALSQELILGKTIQFTSSKCSNRQPKKNCGKCAHIYMCETWQLATNVLGIECVKSSTSNSKEV